MFSVDFASPIKTFQSFLSANTPVPFRIEFEEYNGLATLEWGWNETGSILPIPSQYLSYPNIFISYNVTSCRKDFYFDNLLLKCQSKCGDGIRDNNEEWDDGNTINSDGWSTQWVIDQQYVWVNQGTDLWTKWGMAYVPNEQKDQCIKEDPQVSPTLVNSIIIAELIVNSILMISNLSSAQSFFSTVNFLQLLLLLPLFKFFIPQEIVNYYSGIKWVNFSFGFLNLEQILKLDKVLPNKGNEQTDEYLLLIGIESKNTIVNLTSTNILFIVVFIIHLLTGWWYLISKWNEENWISKKIKKLWQILTFNTYVKMLFELLIIGSISSLSELKTTSIKDINSIISVFFPIIILFIFFILISLNLIYWWVYKTTEEDSIDFKFQQYYASLKITKWARLYHLFDLIRKLSFCTWLIMFLFRPNFERVAAFSLVQILFLSYVLVVRPFSLIRDNIREIVNEILFTFYSISWFFLHSKEDWNDNYIYIFIGSVTLNTIFGTLVATTILLITLKSKLCSKPAKIAQEVVRPIKNITRVSSLDISQVVTNNLSSNHLNSNMKAKKYKAKEISTPIFRFV